MNHNQLPSHNDYEREPQPIDFAKLTTELLESEDVKALPESEQGAFIMDHLLGRIVSAGPIESSKGQKTPLDLVRDMQDYATFATQRGHDVARTLITRQNGMRGMVDALSQDERVGSLWSDLENRIVGGYGSEVIAMSSPAMVGGYLDGKEDTNTKIVGAGWNQAIASEVNAYAMSGERPRWNNDVLLGSVNEDERKGQLKWMRYVDDAKTAGVDMNLVIRSADRLRIRRKAAEDLGRHVTGVSFPSVYDRMMNR